MWLILLLIVNCSRKGRLEKPIIAASIYPVSMITEEIVGTDFTLITLLPPGASPHTFEPTPGIVSALLQSELLILVGGGLESWLEDAIARYKEKKASKILVLTEGEELIPLPGGKKPNPHIWLSPVMMKGAVRRIGVTLSEIYPERASLFLARADSFIARLDSLNLELQAIFGPLEGEGFFSFEPAWSYFARDYGLEELGYLTTDPASQQGAADMLKLLNRLKGKEIRTIFTQKQAPMPYAKSLAKEFGLKLVYLDPIGNPEDTLVNSYIKLIRYNAYLIAKEIGKQKTQRAK